MGKRGGCCPSDRWHASVELRWKKQVPPPAVGGEVAAAPTDFCPCPCFFERGEARSPTDISQLQADCTRRDNAVETHIKVAPRGTVQYLSYLPLKISTEPGGLQERSEPTRGWCSAGEECAKEPGKVAKEEGPPHRVAPGTASEESWPADKLEAFCR